MASVNGGYADGGIYVMGPKESDERDFNPSMSKGVHLLGLVLFDEHMIFLIFSV